MKVTFEIEADLHYEAYPSEPRTWHYPGAPAEIIPTGLSCEGIPFPDELFKKILEKQEDNFIEIIQDELNSSEEAQCYAEHLWEQRTNR